MPVKRTDGKRFLARATSLLGAVSLSALLVGLPQTARSEDPIKIGMLLSVTGSDALNGYNGIAGVKLAVDEINKAGGILGRQIELVQADDQSDPTATVNEARRLAFQEGVKLVIGPQSSQRTIAAIPVFNEAKVLNLSTSGSAQLTPEFGPYHFSINPSADAQAFHIAGYVSSVLKAKSAAILTDNGAQAKSGVPLIENYLKEGNVAITGVQEFQFRSEDKTAQLLSLKGGNPEALVIWANTPEDYGGLLNNLADIGWDGIQMSGAVSQSMLAAPATKVADPALFANVGAVAYNGWTYCPGEDLGQNRFLQFKERLKAVEGERFDDLAPTIVGWLYDSVYVLKAAIEGTNGTDPEKIKAWIETNAGSVQTVSGVFSPSATVHFMVGKDGMTVVKDPAALSPEGLFQRANCK